MEKHKSIKIEKFLDGDKIYLRRLDISDIEIYADSGVNMDLESRIFTGTVGVFTKSQSEKYINSIMSDSSRIDFLIISKEDNSIVGEVVLNDINRNSRNSNIRIAIFEGENFGKGYGTEAMILALDYGFGMFNLHRIDLTVYDFNERGIHVYEKIGFKREGVLRDYLYFNHNYYDAIVMSILEDEFRESHL
ncbi:GNAT family N-acetyltransferase [Oceanirhabdus seepicola]|uniref:GNAT family N-acetyltransferase n=1 Tax=Oceanirhabdus seepicola TaxID=2828781 RepID=A0A9J6P5T7_9CLOT|nr:GNAT family protein [Oceanirhabdus seepicola]MCM1991604.1 GNAT family N-acetyltransferase [Oceanirhabdus seepicola]